MSDEKKEEVISIEQLRADDLNANRGTARGAGMLLDSLRKFGAGRSILVDRNNKIIAGNKTAEQAIKAGITKVRVIDSDGTEIVAVKRRNLSLDDAEGKALALYDNRVAQVNLEWDADAFLKLREQGAKVEAFFLDHELEKITQGASVKPNDDAPEPDRARDDDGDDEGPAEPKDNTSKASMEQLFFDVESFLKFEEVMARLEDFFGTRDNTDTIMAALEYVHANTIASDQDQSNAAG